MIKHGALWCFRSLASLAMPAAGQAGRHAKHAGGPLDSEPGAAHLRCRSKKSSVRRHARSADGAWYSAIGSFRSPTSVSLAKACLA